MLSLRMFQRVRSRRVPLTDQLDLFAGDGDAAEGGWRRCPFPDPPGLWLGSCAWNHHSFDRHFYPAGLAAGRQVGWYARHFNFVEVDSTFYGVPAAATVERWAAAVPPGFRFSLKVPRSVTHEGGLRIDRPGPAQTDWQAFLEVLPRLGGRVGALLVQLGPRSSILQFDLLRALCASAPPEFPVVVELRHPSWNREEVSAWLRESGVVRAWVDHYHDPTREVAEDTPHLFPSSGRQRYVRLLGDVSTKYNDQSPTRRNFTYGSVLFERGADLRRWADLVRRELDIGIPTYVAINNHYQGFTPITACLLRELLAGATRPRDGQGAG